MRLFENVGISSLTNDDIDTKEFVAEKRLFEYTMPPYKCKIISIEKIKMNKDTKERKREYNVLLESCKRKHKDSETICCNLEKTLFHGTNWNAFEKIIQRGFDPDLNKRSRYGKGIYFATNAITSHHYTVCNIEGKRILLVCKVIVGKYGQGTKDAVLDVNQYDSFTDNILSPSIFATPQRFHCFPYCYIVYQVR